jgi:hypothetical protein
MMPFFAIAFNTLPWGDRFPRFQTPDFNAATILSNPTE